MAAEICIKKGNEFVAEGEKKLQGWSFMGMFGASNKYDDCIDCYNRACAQYKIAKAFDKAGETYEKIARMHEEHTKNKNDAMHSYNEAAKCYKLISPAQAVPMFKRVAEMQGAEGKFAQAARTFKEIAEGEEKVMNIEGAIEAYLQAADFFETANSPMSALPLKVSAAGLYAEKEQFDKAIEVYEKVIEQSMDNSSLKWNVPKYMFAALLCQMVMSARKGEMSDTTEKLQKYMDLNPAYETQPSCALVRDLAIAFDKGDEKAFLARAFQYDNLYKSSMDATMANNLYTVQKLLKSPSGPISDQAKSDLLDDLA